jgi:hypothetical protein
MKKFDPKQLETLCNEMKLDSDDELESNSNGDSDESSIDPNDINKDNLGTIDVSFGDYILPTRYDNALFVDQDAYEVIDSNNNTHNVSALYSEGFASCIGIVIKGYEQYRNHYSVIAAVKRVALAHCSSVGNEAKGMLKQMIEFCSSGHTKLWSLHFTFSKEVCSNALNDERKNSSSNNQNNQTPDNIVNDQIQSTVRLVDTIIADHIRSTTSNTVSNNDLNQATNRYHQRFTNKGTGDQWYHYNNMPGGRVIVDKNGDINTAIHVSKPIDNNHATSSGAHQQMGLFSNNNDQSEKANQENDVIKTKMNR